MRLCVPVRRSPNDEAVFIYKHIKTFAPVRDFIDVLLTRERVADGCCMETEGMKRSIMP